jgi:hypothetical protein
MNDQERKKFYVIAVISNPARFKSRVKLYKQFAKEMLASGVQLMTVETVYGERDFEVTEPNNPMHVQLRTDDEVWHKENMINIGVSRLPQDWKYVAWIDADISFLRPDWVDETIHQLQKHPIVQVWQNAIDLGPNGEVLGTHTGFGYCKINGILSGVNWKHYGGVYPHPGYGWAITRDAMEKLGGLFDQGILGSGDHHMAWALMGKARDTIHGNAHKNYFKALEAWGQRAQALNMDIGFVPGTILHHWHGRKKDRKYVDRWQILVNNKFDPFFDMRRDMRGVIRLSGNKPKLRDDIRAYFRSRNEDSVDTE